MNKGAIIAALLALGLAACGGGSNHYAATGGAGGYKVGKPYKINGVWYTPKEDPYYNQVGTASWYGKQFHGKRTANGEIFNMNDMTAAHPTLPMPSYVLVTNLENGRQAVLRVNDRGPFARGRIIDLSRRAAQVLGYEKNGTARVRVQAYPLRDTPRQKAPVMVRQDGDTRWQLSRAGDVDDQSMFVQAGAFENLDSANRVKRDIEDFGTTTISRVQVDGRSLYRVRVGPVASEYQANQILSRIVSLGHATARLVLECNRNC